MAKGHDPGSSKRLRLWPGILIAVVACGVRLFPMVVLDAMPAAMIGFVIGGLAIVLWWLFFSRAPWSERLGAIGLMIIALLATSRLVHESVAGGAMGMLLYIWAIPVMSLALVAWAVASRRVAKRARRASMVATILIACGMWTLLRTDGVTSDIIGSDFRWRWTPTSEERLLAQGADRSAPPPAPAATPATPNAEPRKPEAAKPEGSKTAEPRESPAVETDNATAVRPSAPAARKPAARATADTPAEWPGFRGPARNGIAGAALIDTDWARNPPAQLWRRPIGPGWSSFAVQGDVFYTQEQRGEDEIVACYRVSTGQPVWTHRDRVRFYESNAGAGPRATPSLAYGRVYTFGATGIVNALDARTGAVVWSRNASTDTGVEIPEWGFASSPLVAGDVVIIAASGRLVAYAVATGDLRWLGPDGGAGYSSPHFATIDGVDQVLLLRGSRTISVSPADGKLLWEHTWQPGVGIVQPALVADRDVLLTTGDAMGGLGVRRIAISHRDASWTVEERWTTRGLKPYYNDFVVHDGHAYGFDGSILACIDLGDGARKWKGGRYGSGQLVLLPDQDLMLVLSEEGELALVNAAPDRFTEVARFKAIEGKTWNHPVLVGDILLVRNGEEMAAFRLPGARS